MALHVGNQGSVVRRVVRRRLAPSHHSAINGSADGVTQFVTEQEFQRIDDVLSEARPSVPYEPWMPPTTNHTTKCCFAVRDLVELRPHD